jgi:hypothetical protein
MTYGFKTEYAHQLHQRLSAKVAISFIRDNNMAECACMDFSDAAQTAEIRFKSTAHETVDLAHELIHIRMQFLDGFPLLAWPTHSTIVTDDTQDAVKRIRDAVDDTYVLQQLFDDTGQLPISEVFYREIRRDIKQGYIRLLQAVPSASRPLAAAWLMRLADLSCCEFNSALTANQRQLAMDFLTRFQDKDPPARDLLEHLHQAVSKDDLHDPQHLGKALLDLRDKLGLPSCLHLATRQRVNGKWVLKQ